MPPRVVAARIVVLRKVDTRIGVGGELMAVRPPLGAAWPPICYAREWATLVPLRHDQRTTRLDEATRGQSISDQVQLGGP